jgi:PD-(D/E)XK nuclease superfamily
VVAFQLDLFHSPSGNERGGAGGEGAGGGAAGPAAGAPDPAASPSPAAAPGLVVTRGALAAEALLLATVDRWAAEARREPALLALPVRVVVPSRSLRRHVAARLVAPRGGGPSPAERGGPGRAMAGVAVQTLHGVACEVLERAGEAAPRGVLLFETLVEREARVEPALGRGLGELVDGFLAVASAVADLLDAGLEPEHGEAVDEALASDGPRAASRAEVERARALVRVAVRSARRLRGLGLGLHSDLLRRAAEIVAAEPERALPARAVLLHGFVAASGVAADLLAALLRRPGATLLLDRPPVPGAEEGSEGAATLRLAERVALAAAATAPGLGERRTGGERGTAPAAARQRPRLTAFTAAGAEAEAREVACRLRRLLDGGDGGGVGGGVEGGVGAGLPPRPEGLAVVARDLAAYRLALRRHLSRLGVPFSGVGERGGLLPAGRRAAAVLDLLRWGIDAPADRWLDASAGMSAARRVDLRLALRALGAARLRDVAGLRGREFPGGVALPVRQGLVAVAPEPAAAERAAAATAAAEPATAEPAAAERGTAEPAAAEPGAAESGPAGEPAAGGIDDGAGGAAGAEDDRTGLDEGPPPDEDGEGRTVARARRISGRRLRAGVQAAARVHDRLNSWPGRAPAAAHLDLLGELLAELRLAADPDQPLAAAVGELRREIPGDLALAAEELRPLLERALGGGGQCAIGGEGGGVQLLSVSEARGRTFDHLFLLGLERGVMPRPVREDPLLPDDLRQVLQRVLPDLRLAREELDDERHVFAQLLSAAPEVCLSWRVADDDGKPLSASPLVERLLPALEPRPAPALYPAPVAALSPSPVAAEAEEPSAGGAGRQPADRREAGAGDGRGAQDGRGGGGDRAGTRQAEDRGARPADEHAVLAGLAGSRRELARVLPIAVREVRRELGRPLLDLDAEAVAAARLRVLDELDPDLRTAAGRAAAAKLGPYFGFVGPARRRGGHQLYVTHLEALAACPWQLFLGRLLRIERPPDPLGALPGADPLRLGNLVHRALARIVERAQAAAAAGAAAGSQAETEAPDSPAGGAAGRQGETEAPDSPAGGAAGRQGGAATPHSLAVAVPWPAADELDALLREAAAEVLAEEGLELPGLARALAVHARPFAEAARDLDWVGPGSTVMVAASEVEGETLLEGVEGIAGERRGLPRRLRFRADREDLVDGRHRFTDYKTGQPLSEARDARRRRRQLLGEIRAGKRLQVVAYLLAAGDERALGRYLFLRPDLPSEAREVAVEAGDGEARAAFASAVRALLAAWDAGSFFPRLVDPAGRKEPGRCALCTVAEACLRGDSGARRRLHEWAARAGEAAATAPGRAAMAEAPGGAAGAVQERAVPADRATERSAETALLAVWNLPAAVEGPAGEGGAAPGDPPAVGDEAR